MNPTETTHADQPTSTGAFVTAWCIYDYQNMDAPEHGACLSLTSAEDSDNLAASEMIEYLAGQYESINDEKPDMDELIRAYHESGYTDEEPDGSLDYTLAAIAHEMECSYWYDLTVSRPLPVVNVHIQIQEGSLYDVQADAPIEVTCEDHDEVAIGEHEPTPEDAPCRSWPSYW